MSLYGNVKHVMYQLLGQTAIIASIVLFIHENFKNYSLNIEIFTFLKWKQIISKNRVPRKVIFLKTNFQVKIKKIFLNLTNKFL